MTARSQHIFYEALALPANEKALLAEQLLTSLDLAASKSIDEMWAQESEKRIDAFERGEINAISAQEVFEKPGTDVIKETRGILKGSRFNSKIYFHQKRIEKELH